VNWGEVKSHWNRYRARVAHRWQCLSERELDEIGGDRARLSERIQAVYCIGAEDAERQISAWEEEGEHWDPSSAEGPAPQTPAEVASDSAGKARSPGAERLVATGAFPKQPGAPVHPAPLPAVEEHGYMDDEAERERNESAGSGAGQASQSGEDSRGASAPK
jgi:hypothetical protein